MTGKTVEYGGGNAVWFADGMETPNLSFDFRGFGNKVWIGSRCFSSGSRLTLGNNCKVEIGNDSILNCLEIFAAESSSIIIGENARFTWIVRIHAHESYDVTIGRDCLFADGVWITVSDMHAIIDKKTRERINPGKSVMVGDHVWIGASSSVLKGSRIGSGAVIGAGSIVSGEIASDCIAAGVPARVLRSGVEWVNELS